MRKITAIVILLLTPTLLFALPSIKQIKRFGILNYNHIENMYLRAKQGNVFNQARIAEALINGAVGLLPNYDRAGYWLNRAITTCEKNPNKVIPGCALAYANMATVHFNNAGNFKKDDQQFVKLEKKALRIYAKEKSKYTPTQKAIVNYQIGRIYFWGVDTTVKQDLPKAFALFKYSAEQGFIHAMKKMAIMYRYGLGVKRNLYQAHRWYLRLAKANWIEAQFLVGMSYLNGTIGVTPNRHKASYWLERSARAGYYPAIIELVKLNKGKFSKFTAIKRSSIMRILETISNNMGKMLGKYPVMRM